MQGIVHQPILSYLIGVLVEIINVERNEDKITTIFI